MRKYILVVILAMAITIAFFIACEGDSDVVGPEVTVSDQPLEINISELEKQIHDLINAQRNTHGLSSVSWNPAVSDIARNHSQDMANRGYFSHTNLEGLEPC
ncbi:MAG: CAP domain-containing protein, partial [Planctomycetes bacterium]|nr:CAP domain-containing protein [Planctomycetota bacterium]